VHCWCSGCWETVYLGDPSHHLLDTMCKNLPTTWMELGIAHFVQKSWGHQGTRWIVKLCRSLQSCQYKRCFAYVHMNGCPPDIEAHPGYYGIWFTRHLGSSNIATIPNLILSFSNKVQFSEACLVCQPKGADFLPIKALDLILHARHIAYLTTGWTCGNHSMLSKRSWRGEDKLSLKREKLSKHSWRGEDKTFFEKGEDLSVRLAFNLLLFCFGKHFLLYWAADNAQKICLLCGLLFYLGQMEENVIKSIKKISFLF
jgi:hypothetical protein